MRIYKLTFAALFLAAAIGFSSCEKEGGGSSAVAPSNLQYIPSFLSVGANTTGASVAATVDGTAPFTFSMTSTPDAGGEITINSSTGVINVSGNTASGNYKISVTATNSAGSTTNTSAMNVEVLAPAPITFDSDIKAVLQSLCSPCHLSSGSEEDYTNYTNAKGNITSILDRIQRNEGSPGFMPNMGSSIGQSNIDLIKQWESDGLLEN
jgi:PKD repeat protein